jgi:hypothetical protein
VASNSFDCLGCHAFFFRFFSWLPPRTATVRALERLGGAKGNAYGKEATRAFIAAYLLATEAARPTLRTANDY